MQSCSMRVCFWHVKKASTHTQRKKYRHNNLWRFLLSQRGKTRSLARSLAHHLQYCCLCGHGNGGVNRVLCGVFSCPFYPSSHVCSCHHSNKTPHKAIQHHPGKNRKAYAIVFDGFLPTPHRKKGSIFYFISKFQWRLVWAGFRGRCGCSTDTTVVWKDWSVFIHSDLYG